MKKIIISLSACFILAMTMVGCSGNNGAGYYDQGQTAAENGEIKMAVDSYVTAAVLGFHPSESYYQAGLICEEQLENLPLAIWYYQRAVEMAQMGSSAVIASRTRLELVKTKLAQKEKSQLELWQSGQNGNQEMVIHILEDRCEELTKWTKRLNDENLALRQMLLEAQKQQK